MDPIKSLGITINKDGCTLDVPMAQFSQNVLNISKNTTTNLRIDEIMESLHKFWSTSLKSYEVCLVPIKCSYDNTITCLPSLIHLFLDQECLQERMCEIIMESLEKWMTVKEVENVESLPGATFAQFAWLKNLQDGSNLLRRLTRLMPKLNFNQQESLLRTLPEIFDDRFHDDIASFLIDLLEGNNNSLWEICLEILSQFSISDCLRNKICNFSVHQFDKVDIDRFHSLIKFIHESIGKDTSLIQILHIIRNSVIDKMKTTRDETKFVSVFRQLEIGMLENNKIFASWKSMIDDDLENVQAFDILMFLQIIKCQNSPSLVQEYISRCIKILSYKDTLENSLSSYSSIVEKDLGNYLMIFCSILVKKSKSLSKYICDFLKIFATTKFQNNFESQCPIQMIISRLLVICSTGGDVIEAVNSAKYIQQFVEYFGSKLPSSCVSILKNSIYEPSFGTQIYRPLFCSWLHAILYQESASQEVEEYFSKSFLNKSTMTKRTQTIREASLLSIIDVLNIVNKEWNGGSINKLKQFASNQLISSLENSDVSIHSRVKLLRSVEREFKEKITNEKDKIIDIGFLHESITNLVCSIISDKSNSGSNSSGNLSLFDFNLSYRSILSENSSRPVLLRVLPSLLSLQSSLSSQKEPSLHILQNLYENYHSLLNDCKNVNRFSVDQIYRNWTNCLGIELINCNSQISEKSDKLKKNVNELISDWLHFNRISTIGVGTKSKKRSMKQLSCVISDDSVFDEKENLNIDDDGHDDDDKQESDLINKTSKNISESTLEWFENEFVTHNLEIQTFGPSYFEPESLQLIWDNILCEIQQEECEFACKSVSILTEEIKNSYKFILKMLNSDQSQYLRNQILVLEKFFEKLTHSILDKISNLWEKCGDCVFKKYQSMNLMDEELDNVCPIIGDGPHDLSFHQAITISLVNLLMTISTLCSHKQRNASTSEDSQESHGLRISNRLNDFYQIIISIKNLQLWSSICFSSTSETLNVSIMGLLTIPSILDTIRMNANILQQFDKMVEVNVKMRDWNGAKWIQITSRKLRPVLLKTYVTNYSINNPSTEFFHDPLQFHENDDDDDDCDETSTRSLPFNSSNNLKRLSDCTIRLREIISVYFEKKKHSVICKDDSSIDSVSFSLVNSQNDDELTEKRIHQSFSFLRCQNVNSIFSILLESSQSQLLMLSMIVYKREFCDELFTSYTNIQDNFIEILNLTKDHDAVVNMKIAIKMGLSVVNLILKKWIPLLESHLTDFLKWIAEWLKQTKKLCISLKSICDQSKLNLSTQQSKDGPSLKKSLESLLYKLKQIAKHNHLEIMFEN